MEKHTRVFERFATFENLYSGYLLARRQKRYKREVLEYSAHLEENIVTDLHRLLDKTYHTGVPHPFYEYYPKKRLIHSLPFNDRVINCAAYLQLWPIYSKSFYEHSYGSIPNKGTVKAVKKLQDWLRLVSRKPDKWFVGKLDIAKFFFRVPVEVQLRELGRPLDDPDMMWFLETAIRADGRPLGLPLDCEDVETAERIPGIGMQVGSLISQTTANVVLTPLDHYIKRVLRVPYYIRYMDDMIILCPSKQAAWDAAAGVDEYLKGHLGLQLNRKTAVMPASHGVEFIGRHITAGKILLRKETTLRVKRYLRHLMDEYAAGKVTMEHCLIVIASYMGLFKHTDSMALTEKILEDFVLVRKSHETDSMETSAKRHTDNQACDRRGDSEAVCIVCGDTTAPVQWGGTLHSECAGYKGS